MLECEFCKKEFSSKYALKTHQTKTKACLDIQGEGTTQEFECDDCHDKFFLKQTYERHLTKCIDRYNTTQQKLNELNEKSIRITKLEKTIQELEKTIQELEKTIQELNKAGDVKSSIIIEHEKKLEYLKLYLKKEAKYQKKKIN